MPADCPPTGCLDDNLAAGYVDGVLAGAERARVEHLMDVCATCRRQISDLMRIRMPDETSADAASTPERIGRYLIRGVLGRGGMGLVTRAWDPELEREVAIKLVRSAAPEGALRLAREARALAKVSHPAVLPVYDAGMHHGEVFVVMELIDGETLAEWLARRPPWRDALARCRVAGAGLAAAHAAGLVHRDFKPHNVMCARDGRVLVGDFGLARSVAAEPASDITASGMIVGTPAYMAPEQHLGGDVGPAADQFAFAVTTYEAVYGRRPFGGDPRAPAAQMLSGKPDAAAPSDGAPTQLQAILERGMARRPQDRFHSLAAMLDALAALEEPVRRRWLPFALVMAGTLGVLAVGLAMQARGGDADAGHAAAPVPAAVPVSMPPMPNAIFPADRLAHWDVLGDRALIDRRATAWAEDAELASLSTFAVDARGIVDLTAGGFVQYVYVSPRLAASPDPREMGRCSFVVIGKREQQFADALTGACPLPPAAPRCTFTEIWRRAIADSANVGSAASIELDAGIWRVVIIAERWRRTYPDDC